MAVRDEVYVAACSDYEEKRVEECIRRMFEDQGGAEVFLKKGKNVVIKPNLLMARAPEAATTTHPAVVKAVCRVFQEQGAKVTIADSPGGVYNKTALGRVYRFTGMERVSQETGAFLNWDFSSRKRRFQGLKQRNFDIIAPVAQADVVISIAKMKTHMMTYFSGGVKNLYGVIPGLTKAAYHSQHPGRQDFARLLVDLCRYVQPAYTILDGVEGMDGKGPSGGRVRHGGVLFGSQNPFALDLAAMEYCGLVPERSPVHQEGGKLGLVPFESRHLTLRGDSMEPLQPPFVPAIQQSGSRFSWAPHFLRPWLERAANPYPHITSRCVGCGDCARACPRQALHVANGKAHLDKRKCIKCYCCHEMCPIKAIDV